MIVYSTSIVTDELNLIDLGAPETLGGKPKNSARVDYKKDGMTAGIFEATTGKIEIHFPFTEHATILEGEVTITDKSGNCHTYCPGDSYLIQQGQVVIWEVKGKYVRKSFFKILE